MSPVAYRRRRARVRSMEPAENDARWDEYTLANLGDGHPLSWLIEVWRYHEPLYSELQRVLPEGGRVLEVGAGGGPNLLWLAAHGYQAVGVEYRPKVVAAAREVAEMLSMDVAYHAGDAFDLSAYRGLDAVFSVGMIEHWPYDDSVRAIREQAACARTVLVAIPTPYTRFGAGVTDERFYSRREFAELLCAAGLHNVRVLGYGDVPGTIGRASRSIIPDIPYRRLFLRHLRWPSSSLLGVGTSSAP
jgi:SAM-dependent methyltransferase